MLSMGESIENLVGARQIIGAWINHYNNERLHAGLGYLTPAEFYAGDPTARRAERQAKLEKALEVRQRMNGERLARAA
jgi:putative transposase